MILERVEKDGLIEALYESSNVVASSYNKNQKDLNVTFKNGGNYTYQGVAETDYVRFETAESQGKVLNTNLKKYPFLKHENVNIEDITKRIKEAKNEELDAMLVGIENAMVDYTNFRIHSIDRSDYDYLEKKLDRVTEMITIFKDMKNK
jgi:hypothetical protein